MLPAGAVARELAGDNNYVVVSHGSDVNILMPRRSCEYSAVFDNARTAVFVSTALADAARSYGMATPSVRVIPNGVDLSLFHPGRRGPARSNLKLEGEPVVAFVGGLLEVKGADRLVGLARELRLARPDARLLIAGNGPLMSTLEESLPPNASLLGHLTRDQVADLLAASDALVLPSRSEGWPTVIMEAFACGTPVVGTAVGGIPEALGRCGTVVADGDGVVVRLTAAVCEAFDERGGRREELRSIAEGHSWDLVAHAELESAL